MAQNTVSDLRLKIFCALADPVRLDLIEYLSGGERCVCEILPAFQRSQSSISKHLNVLYQAGILDRRIEGKRTLYSIKDPHVLQVIKAVDALALKQISLLIDAKKSIEEQIIRS
ncbi:MAG: helix-turn-helix transcriptional regulator [Methanothrix sp.]|nr:helix-turn-helix transcriptional regulator [Methanothrix sp.]OPY47119.1 MAG: DNA-binding transcriptional repressor ArsR [Methanosaeta sp. PtaU1.Bin016]